MVWVFIYIVKCYLLVYYFFSEKQMKFFGGNINMKIKSIFTKQLLLYVGTLLAVFILVGIILSMVYTQHYMDEAKEDLINQGMKISKEYKKAYYFTGDLSNLEYELQILEGYMAASIFFIDKNGVVVLTSPGINDAWIGQAIANEGVIKSVLEGNVVTLQGKINGMFDEPVLTVGYPLQTDQIAGIFMCTSMTEIERSLQGMYKMGFSILTAVMSIGIVLVYIFSKKITKPLLQMNEATKVIAGGNFEQRIEIKSEDEIGQLAESFNHMAESLDKYEKVRRDFIANVSHDLRSPLTSIQGFLGAILDGTIPQEKQFHYLNIVLEETKRLTKLTNDIVELSRAQTSNITLEKTRFDINTLIRESIERLEPCLQQKDIKIDAIFAEKETFVCADEDKIARVIYNLVDNAIKFSDIGKKIEIETILKENKKLLVSVKDYGKGIDEEDLKYIFDRFYKVDSSRGKDKTGSGLGLCIVREFLLAHGENIAVKSEKEKGTTFTFSLKLAEKENKKQ